MWRHHVVAMSARPHQPKLPPVRVNWDSHLRSARAVLLDTTSGLAASVEWKSAAPSANCRLHVGLCPIMMIWSDTFCLRLLLAVSISPPLTRLRRLAGAAHPRWVQPAGNTAAKGGMRPLRRVLDQTVLHRVEMNVFQLRCQIPVVADCVLPISPLPDAAFA